MRSTDEIRESLEPLLSEMVDAMASEDDADEPQRVLTGWVVVLASQALDGATGTNTAVFVAPSRTQPDYISVGLLRTAESMVLEGE